MIFIEVTNNANIEQEELTDTIHWKQADLQWCRGSDNMLLMLLPDRTHGGNRVTKR